MANEILDDNQIKNIATFPLSIPLVAGPSAITLSVLISEDLDYNFLEFYQKIFPNFSFTFNIFNYFFF